MMRSFGTPVIRSTFLGRVLLQRLFPLFEAFGFIADEIIILKPFAHDHLCNPVKKRDIGAGLNWSMISANFTMGTWRGSATMIFAPLRYALIILFAMTGCDTLVLEPMMKMYLHVFDLAIELVIAPEPYMAASPATVGECQRRAQWSTLLVPTPARMSFWKA